MNITQISVLLNNPNEILEYFVDGNLHKNHIFRIKLL